MNNGMNSITKSSTLSELCDFNFRVIAPMTLKEHTLYNNQRLICNYVLPLAGDIPIAQITPYHLDEIFSALLQGGSPVTRRRLSPSTVRQTRMALSSVLNDAVKKGILEVNPIQKCTAIKSENTRKDFLDEGQCRTVIRLTAYLPNPQVRRAIQMLLMTGLRRGELIGLFWQDIDFDRKELLVRRTVSRFDRKTIVSTPKTRSSERRIPLSDGVLALLLEQKKYVAFLKNSEGSGWNDTAAVFTGIHGGFMSGDYLNNCFRNMMKDAGMPGMHLHDLRHANASILINEGVPMKVVSEHLGHSSVNVTEKFYTHMFAESQKITAEVIENVLK